MLKALIHRANGEVNEISGDKAAIEMRGSEMWLVVHRPNLGKSWTTSSMQLNGPCEAGYELQRVEFVSDSLRN